MTIIVRTPVQAGGAATATSATRTPGVPSGTAVGDLLLLSACWSGSAITITTPTGWSVGIARITQTNDNFALYYRTADGSATDSPTLTVSSAVAYIATCTALANWTGTPVFASVLGGSATTTITYPSITPGTASDLLLYFTGLRPSTAGVTVTAVAPAGGTGGAVTSQVDGCTNISGGGTANTEQAVFTQQLTALTAVTQQTATVSTAVSSTIGAVIVSPAVPIDPIPLFIVPPGIQSPAAFRPRIVSYAPQKALIQRVNDFEEGTSGTALTAANTAGTGEDAFNTVTISSGDTAAFNSLSYSGSLSAKFVVGAFSSTYARYSFASEPQIWFRTHVYFTANPAGNAPIVTLHPVSGADLQVLVDSTGKVRGYDATLTQQVITTNSVNLLGWTRIEGFFTGGSSGGQIEIKLFKIPDSSVPTETQTSAASLNNGNSISQVNFGIIGPVGATTCWHDSVGFNNSGYLGSVPLPAVQSFRLFPVPPGIQSPAAMRTWIVSYTSQPSVVVPSTTLVAGLAAGTGTAQALGLGLTAGLVTGTGTSQSPVAEVDSAAGAATGTGISSSSSLGLQPGLATGTGTSQSQSVEVDSTAGAATGTGTAQLLGILLATGLAGGTGSALSPPPSGGVNASLSSGTGTSQAPSAGWVPGLATGTGAAQLPGSQLAAGLATGTGSGQLVGSGLVPSLAAGTGTSQPPVASGSQAVNASVSTGSGSAQVPGIQLVAGLASAAGTSQVPGIQLLAGSASGTSTAQSAQPFDAANAGPGAGTGTAQPPGSQVTVTAGSAVGTSTAQVPGLQLSAGLASATGSAQLPGIQLATGVASATGFAQPPSVTGSHSVTAGLAAGTGTVQSSGIQSAAGLASGSGTAQASAWGGTAGAATGAGVLQSPGIQRASGLPTATGAAQPAGFGLASKSATGAGTGNAQSLSVTLISATASALGTSWPPEAQTDAEISAGLAAAVGSAQSSQVSSTASLALATGISRALAARAVVALSSVSDTDRAIGSDASRPTANITQFMSGPIARSDGSVSTANIMQFVSKVLVVCLVTNQVDLVLLTEVAR